MVFNDYNGWKSLTFEPEELATLLEKGYQTTINYF